jgi:hypothetical protein
MRLKLRTQILACLAMLLSAGLARATDPVLARFATAKRHQVEDLAQSLDIKVPTLVDSFFDAVRVDDWETATNLGDRLNKASARFTNSVNDASVSPALATMIWPPIAEVIGGYDQFHDWDNKWLHRFGREIIDSIPKGSIYFGGTDSGRFIISAMCESQIQGNPFFTLTQNQLADQKYLDYLRKIYGDRIYIPSVEDVQKVFQDYLADAQERVRAGKLKPGENVRLVQGRVTASGEVAVMEVNGLLARMIFEKNPDRSFYVQESFPLDWMYPYLSPHGLIFELHAKPLSGLSETAVREDEEYWKRIMGELVGDWITDKTSVEQETDFVDKIYRRKDLSEFKGSAEFTKSAATQKTFSKLRSSIAGLYIWRVQHATDADEKRRMQMAAELAFRQAYALSPTLPETVFRYVDLLNDLHRPSDALVIAKTSLRLDPDNGNFQRLVHTLSNAP